MLMALGLMAVAPTYAAQDNLIAASGEGDLSRVKALLARKAKVNVKTGRAVTALMLASQNGRIEVVRALHAAGAEENLKSPVDVDNCAARLGA